MHLLLANPIIHLGTKMDNRGTNVWNFLQGKFSSHRLTLYLFADLSVYWKFMEQREFEDYKVEIGGLNCIFLIFAKNTIFNIHKDIFSMLTEKIYKIQFSKYLTLFTFDLTRKLFLSRSFEAFWTWFWKYLRNFLIKSVLSTNEKRVSSWY